MRRPTLILAWLLCFVLLAAAVYVQMHSLSAVQPNTRLAVVAVMALPLLLVRRHQALAVGVMLGGTMVTALLVGPGYGLDLRGYQFLAADVVVATAAALRGSRFTAITAAATFVTQLLTILAVPVGTQFGRTDFGGFPFAAALSALALSTAVMIGVSIHQRGQRLDAQRTQAAAAAVVAERLRIAREVHDMVAHSIAVIAIQAGAGRRVMRTQPEEASKALDTIEVTSRETLAGLRRTLSALRQGSAPLDPLPTLADLERLAETTAHAGVAVQIVRLGVPRDLPEEIGLAAYRIIQEAVSNVVRHAHTARCRVTVDYREGEVALEVADEGRGCADSRPGYGLAGMRERAELLGGSFQAGPGDGGGFRVAATLATGAA